MKAFGFSINNVSLFGIVLAIGIVVDDAIVVVEAIEHHIEDGLSPRDAARKAMTEVGGALVAIALVLCSVFIPTAFIAGITGTFFRQFADTFTCPRHDSSPAARRREGFVSANHRRLARMAL
jgi:multidrug efflux pump subunit AcrB